MDNSEIESIMKEQSPQDCALLIYTVSQYSRASMQSILYLVGVLNS